MLGIPAWRSIPFAEIEGTPMRCFEHTTIHSLARIAGLLALLAFLTLSTGLRAQQVVVLKNVNVIDGTGAPAHPNRTESSKAIALNLYQGRHQRPRTQRLLTCMARPSCP